MATPLRELIAAKDSPRLGGIPAPQIWGGSGAEFGGIFNYITNEFDYDKEYNYALTNIFKIL